MHIYTLQDPIMIVCIVCVSCIMCVLVLCTLCVCVYELLQIFNSRDFCIPLIYLFHVMHRQYQQVCKAQQEASARNKLLLEDVKRLQRQLVTPARSKLEQLKVVTIVMYKRQR